MNAGQRFQLVLLWLALFCLPMVLVGAEKSESIRFQAVHVYVDSGSDELAAYQVLVRAIEGDVKIVGIEGGDHEAFKQPPFYDPKAIQQERVILAAFSLKPQGDLPKGKVRVSTIHLQVTGNAEPKFEAKLQAAANHAGKKISPTVSIEPIKP